MSGISIVAQCFTLPLKAICWLILCWCIALCIELGHAFWITRDDVFPPASIRLELESKLLVSRTASTAPLISAPQLYTHLNEGLDIVSDRLAQRIQKVERKFDIQVFNYSYSLRVRTTTQHVLLRVSVLVSYVPVLLIWASLAAVDGLVQRAIRRYRGGRESATIYHTSKRLLRPFTAWSCLVYLCVPTLVNPLTVYLPLVLVIPPTVYLATSRFKKYL